MSKEDFAQFNPARCAIHGERIATIDDKLDQIIGLLQGNGKPGLRIEVDRLNQMAESQRRLTWTVVLGTVTLAVSRVWTWLVG